MKARILMIALGIVSGCNVALGLGDFSVVPADAGRDAQAGDAGGNGEGGFVGECTTNAECTERATAEGPGDAGVPDADAGDAGPIAAVCVRPQYKCARLDSPNCKHITGPWLDDNTVVLGTMFSTVGSQGATNIARQQAVQLAAEEFNSVGGLPPAQPGGPRRPISVVACDEVVDLVGAAKHLVEDLHVPALVGPNTSQDTIDVAQKVSIAGGTLLMSPTSVAANVADLVDNDLVWRLVPSEAQRAPLMIRQINEIETKLKTERAKSTLKLAILYKNDAFGLSSFNSLASMTFNGAALAASSNIDYVKVDAYDFLASDLSPLVAKYRDFAPDIVALIGTGEAVSKLIVPLETAWDAREGGAIPRPYYVLTDGSKNVELLNATKGNDSLRLRLRGTGAAPSPESLPVFNAFALTYQSRFGAPTNQNGVGPSYDALYALAFGIAAIRDKPVTGANLAVALRNLSNGPTALDVGLPKILAALQLLSENQKITVHGTFGPFEWDSKGDTLGTVEIWCIQSGSTPVFAGSGLTLDTKTGTYFGSYTQCP